MHARDSKLREAVRRLPRAHARHGWKVGRRGLGVLDSIALLDGVEVDFDFHAGEQLLNHLYYREETAFVVEGSSLRSPHALKQAMACQRLGNCLSLTILRHPIDRVLSRYWYEGRWGLFKKAEAGQELPFGDWLRQKREVHNGHRDFRLWSVTSELYTKTLSGVVVDKNLEISFVHMVTAQEWLDEAYPIITEWLSTPHMARALGKRLCFATESNDKPPIHAPRRRAAGGHTSRRPASWLPDVEDLELLWNDNTHDLQLYAYATKLVSERIADASLGPLPPTPPTTSAAAYRAWLVARAGMTQ